GDLRDLLRREDEQLLEAVVDVRKIQSDREAVPRAARGVDPRRPARGQHRLQDGGEAGVGRMISTEVMVDGPDSLVTIARYLVTDSVEAYGARGENELTRQCRDPVGRLGASAEQRGGSLQLERHIIRGVLGVDQGQESVDAHILTGGGPRP